MLRVATTVTVLAGMALAQDNCESYGRRSNGCYCYYNGYKDSECDALVPPPSPPPGSSSGAILQKPKAPPSPPPRPFALMVSTRTLSLAFGACGLWGGGEGGRDVGRGRRI